MSLSTAFSNALTGLNANARAAQVVSNNVSNALTEGYGKRELVLSARSAGAAGAGVRIEGVARVVDQALIQDRRLAQAEAGDARERAVFMAELERLVGLPDDPDSLMGRTAAFEAALIEAASRPDLEGRLRTVLTTAQALAGTLSAASDGVQTLREEADASISRLVSDLNGALGRVAELNEAILRNGGAGRDTGGLLDQRQRAIDDISAIVPIRELARENGTIALYTATGGLLLDARAAEIGFLPSATITPDMTLTSGALSGLSLNGEPVPTSGTAAPFAGGALGGLFAVRDELAVTAQSRLDAVARDLVDRFADPAVDATLAPGDAGLFTDRGAAFDPADELGLAGRLTVNALADPAQGGALWRLRDGLGAATPGEAGDGSGLNALAEALRASRLPSSGDVSSVARSANGLAGALTSLIGGDLRAAETAETFASARSGTLRELEFATGVDTDQEMQRLLLIEQNYAANAQVIRTADELVQLLLEI